MPAILKKYPSAETLKEFLEYDSLSGLMTWLERDRKWFPSAAAAGRWNMKNAGRPAFTAMMKSGYLYGPLPRLQVRAHRVAWAIFYGAWPGEIMDHINGIKTDNRIANLRVVSSSDNNRNRALSVSNSSGYIGVSFIKMTGKWSASVWVNGGSVWLGTFDTADEAAKARASANLRYGFHENHGRRMPK